MSDTQIRIDYWDGDKAYSLPADARDLLLLRDKRIAELRDNLASADLGLAVGRTELKRALADVKRLWIRYRVAQIQAGFPDDYGMDDKSLVACAVSEFGEIGG